MSSFSIDAVWEETVVFLRRESGLVLPLALATFGVATVVFGFIAQPAGPAPGAVPAPDMRLIWGLPALFLTMIGNMAISLMALRSRLSVGEALRGALRRVPVAVGLSILVGLVAMIIFILAVVVVTILSLVSPADTATRLNQTVYVALIPIGWLTIRLLVMWPAVADSDTGPIVALRRSLQLTKGNALRALGVTVIFLSVYFTIITISQLALVPVVKLLGLATGQADILRVIAQLVIAFIASVLMMGWTVYLAFAYRRLSA